MSQQPLLRVEGLVKHFAVTRRLFGGVAGQVRAVDGVSFEIFAGETLGLVGESGCGKSTVGRALLRLIEPSAGRVFFDGQDLATLDAAALRKQRRKMQVIFQDPMSSLNPRMRVLDIVGEGLIEHGLATRESVRGQVVRLLEKVGVAPSWIYRYPHEFSGGQRQRVGIARAVALQPKLVVCDEAVSALDVSIRAQVINLLLRLRSELGLSYLFISHDLSVVRHISQRVIVMYLGQIVESAPTEALFESAAHPYTQALLSAVPVPDPTRRGRRVRLLGDVPSPLSPPSGCRFHTRCPVRMARCSLEEPPLFALSAGHQARCFHAEGLAERSDWHAELQKRIAEAEAALVRPPLTDASACAPPMPVQGALSVDARTPARGAWWRRNPRRAALACTALAVLGFALFLAWPAWSGRAAEAKTRRQLTELAVEVRGYHGIQGRLPTALTELGYRLQFVFADGRPRDAWGRPLAYRVVGEHEFEISSLGRDGVESADDLHIAN